MTKRMDEILKYLRRSRYRRMVFNAMGSRITSPQKIVSKTDLDLKTVEHVINSLKEEKLVKKVAKAGKQQLYEPTALGKAALKIRNQWGHLDWKGTNRQRRISRKVTRK